VAARAAIGPHQRRGGGGIAVYQCGRELVALPFAPELMPRHVASEPDREHHHDRGKAAQSGFRAPHPRSGRPRRVLQRKAAQGGGPVLRYMLGRRGGMSGPAAEQEGREAGEQRRKRGGEAFKERAGQAALLRPTERAIQSPTSASAAPA
jgi:hypothetical protein